jgi:hypothetical protein
MGGHDGKWESKSLQGQPMLLIPTKKFPIRIVQELSLISIAGEMKSIRLCETTDFQITKGREEA